MSVWRAKLESDLGNSGAYHLEVGHDACRNKGPDSRTHNQRMVSPSAQRKSMSTFGESMEKPTGRRHGLSDLFRIPNWEVPTRVVCRGAPHLPQRRLPSNETTKTDQQETQRLTRNHQLLEVGSRLPAWERKTSLLCFQHIIHSMWFPRHRST